MLDEDKRLKRKLRKVLLIVSVCVMEFIMIWQNKRLSPVGSY